MMKLNLKTSKVQKFPCPLIWARLLAIATAKTETVSQTIVFAAKKELLVVRNVTARIAKIDLTLSYAPIGQKVQVVKLISITYHI